MFEMLLTIVGVKDEQPMPPSLLASDRYWNRRYNVSFGNQSCRLRLVGLLVYLASSMATASTTDYYEEPGYQPERTYEIGMAQETIDPFSGRLSLSYTDIAIPGPAGLDVLVQRVYSAPTKQAGIIGQSYLSGALPTGVGWDIHFGRLWAGSVGGGSASACKESSASNSGNPILELPDGTRRVLSNSTNNDYSLVTPDYWIAKCLPQGLEVISPDGLSYKFDESATIASQSAWLPSSITDRYGNQITFVYQNWTQGGDTLTLIKEVRRSDNGSTPLLTFNYDPDPSPSSGAAQLTSINAQGEIWNYLYEPVIENPGSSQVTHTGYSFLTEVRGPETGSDQAVWKYEYDDEASLGDVEGLFALISVETPEGAETLYEYTNVVVRSNAPRISAIEKKQTKVDGAIEGTWNYSYTPGRDNNTNIDLLTITTPDGKIEYKHRSPNNPTTGELWKIGTLIEKKLYDPGNQLIQTESYTWDKQTISDQNQEHQWSSQLQEDAYIFSPVLVNRQVTRDGTSYNTQMPIAEYDVYGKPERIIETSGSLNRTTNLTYSHDTTVWTINRPATTTIESAGQHGSAVETSTYFASGTSRGSLKTTRGYGGTANGPLTEYTYHLSGSNNLGNIKSVKDPNGHTTNYSSYERGIPKLETQPQPVGAVITRSVNDEGTIAWEEVDGKRTTFTYDGYNRIKSIDRPRSTDADIVLDYAYGTYGGDDLLRRKMTRGSYVQYQYTDGFGRVRRTTTAGVERYFKFDALGQLICETNPGDSLSSCDTDGIRYEYDILGRIKKRTHQEEGETEYEYLSGNRVRVTDERNKETLYTYRSYGDPDARELIEIVSADGDSEEVTTSIARNRLGVIESVTQGSRSRTMTHLSNYYVSTLTEPETGTTTFGRDKLGNMTSRKVGSSGTTNFTYDALNRLTNVNYPGSTPDTSFEYTLTGNVEKVTRGASSSVWDYSYDDNDNLTEEKLSIDGKTFTIDYVYNANDELQTMNYPGSVTPLSLTFSPNALGQPTQIGSYVTSVLYEPNGGVKQIVYGNGRTTTMTQTDRLFPKTIVTSKPGSNNSVNLTYRYDSAGNTDKITDSLNSLNTLHLCYDGLNRLIGSRNGACSVSNPEITYDVNGNLLSKDIGSKDLAYSYDASNRLDTVANAGQTLRDYAYDAYGNVSQDGTSSFVYDDSGQLVSSTSPSIQYEYDGNNRRVATTENGVTTYSVYSISGLLVYEARADDKLKTDYVHLGQQLIARRDLCDDTLDSDADGIPDCVENRAGLDANNGFDASSDEDGDGLTNLLEYQNGTNYFNADSDGDGMDDGYEVTYGLNPNSASDASSDADGDTLTNLEEYTYGTNPLDPDTDGDGTNDDVEIANGSDPNLNLPAVLVPILHQILS